MATLAPHLSYCVLDGRFVFLDRLSCRYFLLTETLNALFARAQRELEGLSVAELALLRANGLLSEAAGPPLRSVELEPAVTSLLDTCLPPAPLWLSAALVTRELLVRHRLARGRFGSILASLPPAVRASGPPCADTLRLVSAAHDARRYRSRYDQCLPRSISLIQQLRRYQLPGTLVLGVTLSPFAAHAWVQQELTILNDELDRVRMFRPILVV